MGGKLTKSKQQEIGIAKNDNDNTGSHDDNSTINKDVKQIQKKNKRIKDKSNKKTNKSKVDKCTNTDNYILLSKFVEKSVDGQLTTMNNDSTQNLVVVQDNHVNKTENLDEQKFGSKTTDTIEKLIINVPIDSNTSNNKQ